MCFAYCSLFFWLKNGYRTEGSLSDSLQGRGLFRCWEIFSTFQRYVSGRPLPSGTIVGVSPVIYTPASALITSLPGDVSSATMLGQRIVVLNSVQAAVDLLEKRGSIYSDRPVMTMAGELMTWGELLVFSPYGSRFRDIRRFFHRYVGSRGQLEKMAPFHDLQEAETSRFLTRLLHDPENFVDHIRK